jgi:hypothetical protein
VKTLFFLSLSLSLSLVLDAKGREGDLSLLAFYIFLGL